MINKEKDAGYQLMNIENHELRTESNQNIPDTTCDSGNCTITTSASWDNPLTYGYGYRCNNIQGSPCESNFKVTSFFRPFPNREKDQSPQIFASNDDSQKELITEAILRVNISQGQFKGIYENSVEYLAIPSL
jgi:hypothetical protein